MQNSESFFANKSCKYFPCHEGVDLEEFNCMFCYCPLYMLGPDCGGNFHYTEKGRKSCVDCAIPHKGAQGAEIVAQHYEDISKRASL